MSDKELDQVANELFLLIRPYMRRSVNTGEPNFKRTLKADEIQSVLKGVHTVIVKLKRRDRFPIDLPA